jgi:hypothetical protein
MQALKSDVRSASTQLLHDSDDFTSPKHGGTSSISSRGSNSCFTIESLGSNSVQPNMAHFSTKDRVDIPSPSVYQDEENIYGFVESSHRNISSQIRSPSFEQKSSESMYPKDTHPLLSVSGSDEQLIWGMSGIQKQEVRKMLKKDDSSDDFEQQTSTKIVQLPHLSEFEDEVWKPRFYLDDMQKELQDTLHQLKVLHAFPPGSKFEVEHSGVVKAILAMTHQLAALKESTHIHGSVTKPLAANNKISVSDLRDLVSRAFKSESTTSGRHPALDVSLQFDSSQVCCSRNNLISIIRECLAKARSEWSAQYNHLEEQFLKSCQEIQAVRHESIDAIEKATAQYKDADQVWETTHSQHLITIGHLREQLHNITVRYSNLQIQSKSEQESQAKEFRQQISHLQGQVSALKQLVENQVFHNSEETRRYEALSVEHDKLLQTLSMLPQRDEHNEVLSAENAKLQLILQQKQSDYDTLASKCSNLQNHFNQQQSSFQQLLNSSSSSKEEIAELRSRNSELLQDQQRIRDSLAANFSSNSALENENNRLKQCLEEKCLEITAKENEIRQHELFQLAWAESESEKLQECTSILQETRNLYSHALPGRVQDSKSRDSKAPELVDLCDFIRADVTAILDRQSNLEKTAQELRQRIKTLRTQAKVASSKALKDTEDRIYAMENMMDHTVDALSRQLVLDALDGAKTQLRDFHVAHEHHYIMGMQDIQDRLYKSIMETTIRDKTLRARTSAVFEQIEKVSDRHAYR